MKGNDEAMQEFDEIFSVFQFEENKVKNEEVYNILRLVGLFPSNKEAKEVISKLDTSNAGYIERDALKNIIGDLHFNCTAPLNMEKMLSFLTKDGKVSLRELTIALTRIGETVAKKDIEILLKDIPSQYGDHVPVAVIAEVLNIKDIM